ncbi:MAG: hypothetical protein M3N13_05660 [Candidatus Eremiobacteraeota bacterium]|nr:hypothetical protein [Candidatus Eremiobacteraeota bacterium]
MSFLLRWLGIGQERPANISVRPSRTLMVGVPYDAAFDRCVYGLQQVVGAQVRAMDRETGTIEATFGLMFSERIACDLRRIDSATTEVAIESRRIAGAELPKDSAVLDRLSQWIAEER